MDLTDFKIRQLIFEVRYNHAYILWDRAGAIAHEMAKLWPNMEITDSAPNQQTFRSANATITSGISTSHIAIHAPRSITQFTEQLEQCVKIWTSILELNEFSRVGTRTIFAKTFQSSEAANTAIVDLGIIKHPSAPFFNHKSSLTSCEVKMHWDDETSQTLISIRPERQVMEIAGFFENDEIKETKSSNALILDIDRAAKGEIEISKFRVSEWLEGVRHVIHRDIDRVLRPK